MTDARLYSQDAAALTTLRLIHDCAQTTEKVKKKWSEQKHESSSPESVSERAILLLPSLAAQS